VLSSVVLQRREAAGTDPHVRPRSARALMECRRRRGTM
jgi:hypothetical protein